MSAINRRDLCLTAGVLAVFGGLLDEAQNPNQNNGSASEADTIDMTKSRVFRFDQMVPQQSPNGDSIEFSGVLRRPAMHGTVPTGEFVEVHETTVPAGKMPHPPHKHRNSEFVLIREGKMEYWNEDGKHVLTGPGDIIYSASNQLHGWKNTGDTNATYFVVMISHG
jgi:quercetin dioxygenase-like cupin family protein